MPEPTIVPINPTTVDPILTAPIPPVPTTPIVQSSPPTSLPTTRKKTPLMPILVSVLTLSLLVLAGYFYWQTISLKQQLAITPTPLPTASTDLTINWQSIAIDGLGLSFKLPPEITDKHFSKVSTPTEKGSQICTEIGGIPQGFKLVKSVKAGGASCTLFIFTIGQTSFDHEAGREAGFADYKQFVARPNISQNLITEYTNKSGVEIIKIMGNDENGFPVAGTPGEGAIGALINTGNETYPAITVQMKLTNTLTSEVFDQILSTFKFADTTTDWQTYTNNTIGFSIQYPAGWRKQEWENGVGFGPQEIGEDTLIGINFYPKEGNASPSFIDEIGSQFPDRVVKSESVIVDKTKVGKIIVTTPSNPTWYSESIIFETTSNYIVVGNGAMKDEDLPFSRGVPTDFTFEKFYTTFRFIN